jgi:hypothetical protein
VTSTGAIAPARAGAATLKKLLINKRNQFDQTLFSISFSRIELKSSLVKTKPIFS